MEVKHYKRPISKWINGMVRDAKKQNADGVSWYSRNQKYKHPMDMDISMTWEEFVAMVGNFQEEKYRACPISCEYPCDEC